MGRAHTRCSGSREPPANRSQRLVAVGGPPSPDERLAGRWPWELAVVVAQACIEIALNPADGNESTLHDIRRKPSRPVRTRPCRSAPVIAGLAGSPGA